jgi:hypothetical protein
MENLTEELVLADKTINSGIVGAIFMLKNRKANIHKRIY